PPGYAGVRHHRRCVESPRRAGDATAHDQRTREWAGSRDVSRAAEDDRPFPPCRAAVGVLTRWPTVPPLRCAHFVRPHGARRTGHVLVPVVSARPHLAVAAAVADNGDERAIGPRDLLNRHAW